MKVIPNIVPENIEQNQESSYLDTEIQTTTKKVAVLLNDETKNEVDEKQENLEVLMKEFEKAVREKEEEIGYAYKLDKHRLVQRYDYTKRLCISDERFDEILKSKILNDEKLSNLYNEIILIYNNKSSRNIITNSLKEKYLENLVYEIMDNEDYIFNKSTELTVYGNYGTSHEIITRSVLSQLNDDTLTIVSEKNTFGNAFESKPDEFIEFIKKLPDTVKYINFDNYIQIFGNNNEKIIKFLKILPKGIKILSFDQIGKLFCGEKSDKKLINFAASLPQNIKILQISSSPPFDTLYDTFGTNSDNFIKFISKLPQNIKILQFEHTDIKRIFNEKPDEVFKLIDNLPSGLNTFIFDMFMERFLYEDNILYKVNDKFKEKGIKVIYYM